MTNYPPGVTGGEPQIAGDDRPLTTEELQDRARAFLDRYGHHLTLCPAWNWEYRNGSNEPALVRKKGSREYQHPLTIRTGKPCTCGMVTEFYDLLNEVGFSGVGLAP